jgi:hypothetical protein
MAHPSKSAFGTAASAATSREMPMMTKMNKRLGLLTLGALVAGAGVYAWSGMNTARATFDPSRLATVEQDTMVRSVVATGKVEPMPKHAAALALAICE